MAGMNTSETVSTIANHKDDDREKCYATFTHQGKPVCIRVFKFLHGIREKPTEKSEKECEAEWSVSQSSWRH